MMIGRGVENIHHKSSGSHWEFTPRFPTSSSSPLILNLHHLLSHWSFWYHIVQKMLKVVLLKVMFLRDQKEFKIFSKQIPSTYKALDIYSTFSNFFSITFNSKFAPPSTTFVIFVLYCQEKLKS